MLCLTPMTKVLLSGDLTVELSSVAMQQLTGIYFVRKE